VKLKRGEREYSYTSEVVTVSELKKKKSENRADRVVGTKSGRVLEINGQKRIKQLHKGGKGRIVPDASAAHGNNGSNL
jgi:hypothetical protein